MSFIGNRACFRCSCCVTTASGLNSTSDQVSKDQVSLGPNAAAGGSWVRDAFSGAAAPAAVQKLTPPQNKRKKKPPEVVIFAGQRPKTWLYWLNHNAVTQPFIPGDFLLAFFLLSSNSEGFQLFTFDCSFPNTLQEKVPDPHCPIWLMPSRCLSFRRRSCNSLSETGGGKRRHGDACMKKRNLLLSFHRRIVIVFRCVWECVCVWCHRAVRIRWKEQSNASRGIRNTTQIDCLTEIKLPASN